MDSLWAPWRIKYIEMEKPKGCILCDKPKEDRDAENYILYRGKLNFVIMNAFPYNPGHLMIVPYRHLSTPEELTAAERHDHYDVITLSLKVLRETFHPGGFNTGMNIGRVAGAGIEDHIHTHIVPRWSGDTNFIPVIGNTKVINEAMAETYKKLKIGFDKLGR